MLVFRLTHVVAALVHPENVDDLCRDLRFGAIAYQAIHGATLADVILQNAGKLSIRFAPITSVTSVLWPSIHRQQRVHPPKLYPSPLVRFDNEHSMLKSEISGGYGMFRANCVVFLNVFLITSIGA